jgi:hypothetical protein
MCVPALLCHGLEHVTMSTCSQCSDVSKQHTYGDGMHKRHHLSNSVCAHNAASIAPSWVAPASLKPVRWEVLLQVTAAAPSATHTCGQQHLCVCATSATMARMKAAASSAAAKASQTHTTARSALYKKRMCVPRSLDMTMLSTAFRSYFTLSRVSVSVVTQLMSIASARSAFFSIWPHAPWPNLT